MPGWEGGIWNRTLMVVLVISVLGAMAAVGYTIATPKEGEKFTEFYNRFNAALISSSVIIEALVQEGKTS